MTERISPISIYLSKIKKNIADGNATEHTHRPALKSLLEMVEKGITATNEPKRIRCGSPDFQITRKGVPVGHVETKDIGTDLDEMQRGKGSHGEQFIRYRDGLPNWILTDYLQFRWFVNGENRLTVCVAEIDAKAKLKLLSDGEEKFKQLLTAFLNQEALTIGTAKDLARRLAGMTRIIRDLIVKTFDHEKEQGLLHNWLAAFRETLIPDLNEKQFADMFAQTLTYGLFAAWINTPLNKVFSREMAAYNLPKTNPFLRKLFAEIAGVDMPDSIAWAVDDIVQLLKHADMSAILKDFGKGRGKEDPVVHFYETFLAAYDPKMREIRGVYYTPEPVVSYIVRSIDHLLKTRFNRPKGLADENTLILDPATGTATFLYFVIDLIHQKFAKQAGAWDDYVAKHLLNRIFGFELLMAPYAIAHLKIGMQLQETGYKFDSDQRLGIYLTNTLEEAAKKSEKLFASWVADEANAAAKIKRDDPILVVLGNPPYSGVSANRSEWITNLVADYRFVDSRPLGEKKVWLKNDYIKFLRFGEWRIDSTGYGILAFITDHSYLDSPTFRGMRQHLQTTFDDIYILNLHGNAKRRETAPDGGVDQNVFDITQGVAIAVFVKDHKKGVKGVHYADIWGNRPAKYKVLSQENVSTTPWKPLSPIAPFYEFVPLHRRSHKEYQEGWRITDIFPIGSNGVQTSRDDLVVDFERDLLANRIEHFLDPSLSDAEVRAVFFGAKSVGNYEPGDTRGWKLGEARVALRKVRQWRQVVTRYLYRPFDARFLLYHDSMVDWPRPNVMRHLQQPNRALCVGRAGLVASGPWNLIFCTQQICDHNLFYRGSSINFPLYLYPDGEMPNGLFAYDNGRLPNLSSRFVETVSAKLRMDFVSDGQGNLRKTVGPDDIFHYTYALFHSPTYRKRYAEFLKIDFPRLPLTSDVKLFRVLATKGAELVSLHLLESPKLEEFFTDWPVKGDNLVEKVQYTEKNKRVWINKTQYFGGVPKEVWEFHIGGYQVCDKWLKDRKHRALSYDDLMHYQKITVALKETLRLMTEIDECIPHWPLA